MHRAAPAGPRRRRRLPRGPATLRSLPPPSHRLRSLRGSAQQLVELREHGGGDGEAAGRGAAGWGEAAAARAARACAQRSRRGGGSALPALLLPPQGSARAAGAAPGLPSPGRCPGVGPGPLWGCPRCVASGCVAAAGPGPIGSSWGRARSVAGRPQPVPSSSAAPALPGGLRLLSPSRSGGFGSACGRARPWPVAELGESPVSPSPACPVTITQEGPQNRPPAPARCVHPGAASGPSWWLPGGAPLQPCASCRPRGSQGRSDGDGWEGPTSSPAVPC